MKSQAQLILDTYGTANIQILLNKSSCPNDFKKYISALLKRDCPSYKGHQWSGLATVCNALTRKCGLYWHKQQLNGCSRWKLLD